jgi:hypothetical protein
VRTAARVFRLPAADVRRYDRRIMDEAILEALREAIRTVHGCDSRWVESVSVKEPYWTGDVQVFRLIGHATADRCYAWSQQAGRERRHHAVLHGATVGNASQAVRATIAARERTRVF